MAVDSYALSEGESQVINATTDARRRVTACAGELSLNTDYVESGTYIEFKVSEFLTTDKAVAVRGPGRVLVTDLDPPAEEGVAPDLPSVDPFPTVKDAVKPKKRKKASK